MGKERGHWHPTMLMVGHCWDPGLHVKNWKRREKNGISPKEKRNIILNTQRKIYSQKSLTIRKRRKLKEHLLVFSPWQMKTALCKQDVVQTYEDEVKGKRPRHEWKEEGPGFSEEKMWGHQQCSSKVKVYLGSIIRWLHSLKNIFRKGDSRCCFNYTFLCLLPIW